MEEMFVDKPEMSTEAKCRRSRGRLSNQPVTNEIMKLTTIFESEQDLPKPGCVHACITLSLFIVVLQR